MITYTQLEMSKNKINIVFKLIYDMSNIMYLQQNMINE